MSVAAFGLSLMSGGGTLAVMLGALSPWWLFLTVPVLVFEGVGLLVSALD